MSEELSPFDRMAHMVCRQMHGSSMCRCWDRGARPCASIETVTRALVAIIRDYDRAEALAARIAKKTDKHAPSL